MGKSFLKGIGIMATRFNDISFFDGRSFIEAKSGVIKPYNGSNLYNVRPASTVIPFTNASNSPTVEWDANNAGKVTFTHAMNCYPIVSLYKSNGEQVYPTIKILSGTSFSLDFESSSRPIPEGETWQCVVTYGADYGNNGNVNTEIASLIQYLQEHYNWDGSTDLPSSSSSETPSSSSEPSSSSSEEPSSSSSAAPALEEATNAQIDARASSTTIITPHNLLYAVRSVVPNVTEIPSSTSSYTMYGAASTLNNHCCNYTHVPYQDSTYILQDSGGTSLQPTADMNGGGGIGVHEIVLEVNHMAYPRSSGDDFGNWYCWFVSYSHYVYTQTDTPVEGVTAVYDGMFNEIGTVALYDSVNNQICLSTSCSFEDAFGNPIVPLSTPTIGMGSIVQYICRWSNTAWKWFILPVQLQ